MFKAKNLLKQSSNLLVKQPARTFQHFTRTYMTGFDRMLSEKIRFFRIGGWWFALFGLANIGAYGASLFMTPENY